MNRPKAQGVSLLAAEIEMAKLIYTRLQDHPRETYFATSGSLIVGRIDCIHAGPAAAGLWMWGMQLDIGATPFRRGATVGSHDEALAALEAAWGEWKLWAGLQDNDLTKPIPPALVEPSIKIPP